MTHLSFETWAMVGAVAAGSAVGFLYVIACMLRNEQQLQELTARMRELRDERLARAREIAQSEARVVDIALEGVNAPSSEGKPGKK